MRVPSRTSKKEEVNRAPFELPPGQAIPISGAHGGSFTVLSPLAAGASSQAWLARRQDGLIGVLKTIRWTDQPGHELKIEEQILRQLRSKNLVKFLGKGEREGRLVLAYERAFRNPLLVLSEPQIRTRLPRDPGTRYYPLPPRMALSLAVDLLRAIEHMHALGFVHHDVKPANLMMRLADLEQQEHVPLEKLAGLASTGQPQGVLIDIGATRSLVFLEEFNRGEVDPSIVPPQLTLNYAPPESLLRGPQGDRPFLHPSLDVYAAALVIYASVSGCGPYDHEDPGLVGLEPILAAKAREREGKLQPIAWRPLAGAPGIDKTLAEELFRLLKAWVSPRLEERPTARVAREKLETLCAEQGITTAPRSGRLAQQAAPEPRAKLPNSAGFYAELSRIEEQNKRPPKGPRRT